jgi:hypothetical protein
VLTTEVRFQELQAPFIKRIDITLKLFFSKLVTHIDENLFKGRAVEARACEQNRFCSVEGSFSKRRAIPYTASSPPPALVARNKTATSSYASAFGTLHFDVCFNRWMALFGS